MAYDFNTYPDLPHATVYVADGDAATTVPLDDLVHAMVDEHGDLVELVLSDTTMFGSPFDQPAAGRAVAWARERLAGNATA